MTRSIANWTGIAAICLAILFVPLWNGAMSAAEEANAGFAFTLSEKPDTHGGHVHLRTQDKDCIGDFESRNEAQRFLIEHGGPKHDPHGLDPDGDGKACEGFDY